MKNCADRRLLMALENIRVCVWRWSAATETIEYFPDDTGKVIGLPWKALPRSDEETLALIHPDDRDRMAQVYRKSSEDGSGYDVEYRVIGPDECSLYIHETARPEFDDAGDLVGSVGTWRNVTERRRVENGLRESERRLQAATKMAKLGYFIWDMVNDRCLYCSEEYARIHGMSVEEYLASVTTLEDDSRLVHPDDRPRYLAVLKETLEYDTPFEHEYRIVGKDGKVRHVREKEIFYEVKDGVDIMSEGTLQDITEIRQAEERLRQAQKMEAIGQLTGGLAHDFNNLLAAIQGNAELLAQDLGRCDPRLQTIIRSTQRGEELTQRLLAFSRKQPLQPQPVDVAELMARMQTLFEPTLGHGIAIATELPTDLWCVLADPGQLENALLNLAINARDAMPAGGRLTVRCANARLDAACAAQHPETAAGDYVTLAVSDTGEGMSAEVREHAFEPFFTTRDVGKGSGLGLSMVYGFALQSGGHATIDSAPGRGTTVTLYLPRAAQRPSGGVTRDPNELQQCGNGETVLVVEDDGDVRAMVVNMLDSLGYRTVQAAEAAAAQAILARGEQVDLVLCDVVLRGSVSGPAFAEAAQLTEPGLKVVFMSGYSAEAAENRGILGSTSVLLNKPFKRVELAKVLRGMLGG